MLQLLTALGVVSRRPAEDHEAAVHVGEAVFLLLAILLLFFGLPSPVALHWVAYKVPLHEVAVLVGVLHWELVVRARCLEQLVEKTGGAL